MLNRLATTLFARLQTVVNEDGSCTEVILAVDSTLSKFYSFVCECVERIMLVVAASHDYWPALAESEPLQVGCVGGA